MGYALWSGFLETEWHCGVSGNGATVCPLWEAGAEPDWLAVWIDPASLGPYSPAVYHVVLSPAVGRVARGDVGRACMRPSTVCLCSTTTSSPRAPTSRTPSRFGGLNTSRPTRLGPSHLLHSSGRATLVFSEFRFQTLAPKKVFCNRCPTFANFDEPFPDFQHM